MYREHPVKSSVLRLAVLGLENRTCTGHPGNVLLHALLPWCTCLCQWEALHRLLKYPKPGWVSKAVSILPRVPLVLCDVTARVPSRQHPDALSPHAHLGLTRSLHIFSMHRVQGILHRCASLWASLHKRGPPSSFPIPGPALLCPKPALPSEAQALPSEAQPFVRQSLQISMHFRIHALQYHLCD